MVTDWPLLRTRSPSLQPQAECVPDADCTDEFCNTDTLVCVGCLNDDSCTNPTAPVCLTDANYVCGSYDECTGDDALEPNSDGPAGASDLAIPSTTNAKICGDLRTGVGENEADWYKFTIAAPTDLSVTMSWNFARLFSHDPDLDITIYDSTFTFVDSSVFDFPEMIELTALPAGTYYIKVSSSQSIWRLFDARQPVMFDVIYDVFKFS